MPVHYAGSGDSLTPLGATLKQKNTAGRLVAVNLTGRVVTAIVRDVDGALVIAETSTGVSVISAADGQVAYDFPTPPANLPDGWYFVQFRVYGTGGEAGEYDTYPAPDPKLRMRVYIGTV
jgi:hypothetical protein